MTITNKQIKKVIADIEGGIAEMPDPVVTQNEIDLMESFRINIAALKELLEIRQALDALTNQLISEEEKHEAQ